MKFPDKPLDLTEAENAMVRQHIAIQFAFCQPKTRELFYKICKNTYNQLTNGGRNL